MITFVYGGSGSGKSEYAESLVMQAPASLERFYIATMKAYGEEGRMRVQRHRRLRAGKGFRTIECPEQIGRVLEQIEHPEKAVLLLECISNLVANEMFDSALKEEGLSQRILAGVQAIAARTAELVIVSVNVFEDGTSYDPQTVAYMAYLGQVNRQIAALSDHVVEVVAGIPVNIK